MEYSRARLLSHYIGIGRNLDKIKRIKLLSTVCYNAWLLSRVDISTERRYISIGSILQQKLYEFVMVKIFDIRK